MVPRRPLPRAGLLAFVAALALFGLSACGAPTVTLAPVPMVTMAPVAAATGATFQVAYDEAMPQQARGAFEAGIAIWSARLTSPVPIRVKVTWTRGGRCRDSCTLASAGPTRMAENFANAPQRDTLYPIALANALAGTKLNGGPGDDPIDIEADFNSQADWFYGDGTPSRNRTSFIATAVHELAHGLGFNGSLTYEDGVGSFDTPPNIFDRFVVNGAGQRLIEAFPNGSTALGTQLVGDSLFFDGARARAAAGGARPKLYAPAPWEEGSSLSHLDQGAYIASADAMMTPNDESVGTATPGPITAGLFADLGWTLAPAASTVGAPRALLAPRVPGGSWPQAATIALPLHPRHSFRAVRSVS